MSAPNLTDAEYELCHPELDPRRVAMVAELYGMTGEAVIFILREYDNAVAEDPLGHEHYGAVAEHLEVPEDTVGHVVTSYMEPPQTAGAGKTGRRET